MAIATARGRADCNEDGISTANSLRKIQGERQALLLHIGRNKIFEAGLENRNLATLQHGNAIWVFVDANDIMAEVSQTGTRHQAHIA